MNKTTFRKKHTGLDNLFWIQVGSEPVGQLHRSFGGFLCIHSARLMHQVFHWVATLPRRAQRYSLRRNRTTRQFIQIDSSIFGGVDIFIRIVMWCIGSEKQIENYCIFSSPITMWHTWLPNRYASTAVLHGPVLSELFAFFERLR